MMKFLQEPNVMESLLVYLESARFWVSVILLGVGLIISLAHRKILERFKGHPLIMDICFNKTSRLHFIYILIVYLFWILLITLILQINGINIGSLITGLGIVGIIVGFALQDVLKDIMMGVDIMANKYFSIGDVVRYKGVDGHSFIAQVEAFNVKVTKLYDFNNGNHYTLSNRIISEIEVVSDWLDVSVPASYDVSKKTMDEVCGELCAMVRNLKPVSDCRYLGTKDFADSTIYYLIRVFCPPQQQAQVKRDINGLIQQLYESKGLSIPFNQLDVHLDQD